MSHSHDFRLYRREFTQPLQTAHGPWRERTGWILRKVREDRVAYGEVAPVHGFGNFSVDWQKWLLRWKAGDISVDTPDIPGPLSFAMEALESGLLADPENESGDRNGHSSRAVCSAALMALEYAGESLSQVLQSGYRTIKTKIGVYGFDQEYKLLERWLEELPQDVILRLDANEGLDIEQTKFWMDWLSDKPQIEFLEQPLPVGMMDLLMDKFSADQLSRIALDESVCSLKDLTQACEMNWPGFFVIKPALIGAYRDWSALLGDRQQKVVLSSVFETAIGFTRLLEISQVMGEERPENGFGTRGFFADDGLDGYPPSHCWHINSKQESKDSVWFGIST